MIAMELTGQQSERRGDVPLTEQRAQVPVRLREPVCDDMVYRRTARVDLACNVMFAAVAFLSIVGFTAWHFVNASAPAPAIPIRTAAAVVPTVPAEAPAETPQPPVHVRNPFDATETFEFPAGTTDAQAREAMADVLLQRARERLAQRVVRYASLHVQAGATENQQPEVLVSKLNGDTN